MSLAQNVEGTTESASTSGRRELSTDSQKRDISTCHQKKPRLNKVEEATTTALRTASEVMSNVCQRMGQPKQLQVKSDETRAFCDMLHHQLSSFDVDKRQEVQFEIQQVIMAHRRRISVQTYTSVHPTYNYPAANQVASQSAMSDSSTVNYISDISSPNPSLSSSVQSAYNTVLGNTSEDVSGNCGYNTYYDM